MKNFIAVIFFIALFLDLSFAQEGTNVTISKKNANDKIVWYNWSQVDSVAQLAPRKVMVYFYTNYCAWCHKMESVTLAHPDLAQYINDNFISVKFDAQHREELIYKDKSYKYVNRGKSGYHGLALQLLKGYLSFPSIAFLDEDSHCIQSVPGYKNPFEFEKILFYFGNNDYLRMPWSNYEKIFSPKLIKGKK